MTFSNTPLSTFRNMEMIREYESDGKTTSSSNDELGPRQSRQVYLVTYSQADRTKFPTRHSFAEAVVASFSSRFAVVSKQPFAFVKRGILDDRETEMMTVRWNTFNLYKQPLSFVKHGILDDRETEMMTVRWNTFNLYNQIPGCRQKAVNPCPACFASFILDL